jgi:hypothetical protein
MAGRFDHLKKKTINTELSKDEFIQDAESEHHIPQAKLKISKKDILLSVSGRMNREKNCGKPNLIYLKKDLERDITKYCHGNKGLIINYLLRKGLDQLVKDGELILHMEDI